jgi:metallothionein
MLIVFVLDQKGEEMANEAGTLLTCGHEGCGCRVRIEVECHCDGADQAYRCACGDEMVAVS